MKRPTKRAIRAAVEKEVAPVRTAVAAATKEIEALRVPYVDAFYPAGGAVTRYSMAASIIFSMPDSDFSSARACDDLRRRSIDRLAERAAPSRSAVPS